MIWICSVFAKNLPPVQITGGLFIGNNFKYMSKKIIIYKVVLFHVAFL